MAAFREKIAEVRLQSRKETEKLRGELKCN